YIAAGVPRRREIALTFDDGPSKFTPAILHVLRRKHAPATFFVLGSSVRLNRRLLRREERERLAIGDHTMTHPFLARLRARAQRWGRSSTACAGAATGW